MSYMSHNILATQLNCIGANVLVSLLWLIISHYEVLQPNHYNNNTIIIQNQLYSITHTIS